MQLHNLQGKKGKRQRKRNLMAPAIVKGDADTLKTPAIAPRLFPNTAQCCKLMPSSLQSTGCGTHHHIERLLKGQKKFKKFQKNPKLAGLVV